MVSGTDLREPFLTHADDKHFLFITASGKVHCWPKDGKAKRTRPVWDDAARTVRQYGEELKDYVHTHVRPVAPDGRPWAVTVREVIPVVEKEPDVRVALTLTPR